MTLEQVIEIIERYKLRIPPTVYYELLADVREAEEEQEPTTKNDLGVDCIDRKAIEKHIEDGLNSGKYGHDAVNIMAEIHFMPSVTPQPCDDAVSRKTYMICLKIYL